MNAEERPDAAACVFATGSSGLPWRPWPATRAIWLSGSRAPKARWRPRVASRLTCGGPTWSCCTTGGSRGAVARTSTTWPSGPGGITVIDTKSSRGHVRLATVGLVNRREVLFVGRWDRTHDLDAVERQIDAITQRLRRIGIDVGDVRGALCFPYMRRAWLHRSRVRGGLITVDDPRHIARLIRRPGGLSTDEIARLTHAISQLFPAAAR
jgi:hypothetical protein